ncbi:MAG TPA: nitroreductase family protein [Syntrophorhabdaceae bacterium]|nr:nitroreductase family protein [Syntrophorhabdaceae bacterium]
MLELLRTRCSIRKYETKPIQSETQNILKEAVLRSPSGRGINPWKFIFVDDKDLLQKLAKSKEHGSSFLKGAALGIVVCGDESKTDVWIEDCSIASIIIQLTAHSLGLGTCWIQIRNRFYDKSKTSEEYVRELLGIPREMRVESIISIGYPAETRRPVSTQDLTYKKIKCNRYD